MIKISENYDVSSPPELYNEPGKPNEIYTKVEIINFDSVDTVLMSVGLTVEISLKWEDQNVEYENDKNAKESAEEFQVIADDENKNIW